jgi:aconitate hydratase 2/2-methylisocitrate dehydratase
MVRMTYAPMMACNYPNRINIDTPVYLGSAELAAVSALMGKIPTVQAYLAQVEVVNKKGIDIYRYMNFDQIEAFRAAADTVEI